MSGAQISQIRTPSRPERCVQPRLRLAIRLRNRLRRTADIVKLISVFPVKIELHSQFLELCRQSEFRRFASDSGPTRDQPGAEIAWSEGYSGGTGQGTEI